MFKSLKEAEEYYEKNLARNNEDEAGLEIYLEQLVSNGQLADQSEEKLRVN